MANAEAQRSAYDFHVDLHQWDQKFKYPKYSEFYQQQDDGPKPIKYPISDDIPTNPETQDPGGIEEAGGTANLLQSYETQVYQYEQPPQHDLIKVVPYETETLNRLTNATKRELIKQSRSSNRVYILDSGASFHLLSVESLTQAEQKCIYKLPKPVPLTTANGQVTATHAVKVFVHQLDIILKFYLLSNVPPLISTGMLVRCNQFGFWWKSNKAILERYGRKYQALIHSDVPLIIPDHPVTIALPLVPNVTAPQALPADANPGDVRGDAQSQSRDAANCDSSQAPVGNSSNPTPK